MHQPCGRQSVVLSVIPNVPAKVSRVLFNHETSDVIGTKKGVEERSHIGSSHIGLMECKKCSLKSSTHPGRKAHDRENVILPQKWNMQVRIGQKYGARLGFSPQSLDCAENDGTCFHHRANFATGRTVAYGNAFNLGTGAEQRANTISQQKYPTRNSTCYSSCLKMSEFSLPGAATAVGLVDGGVSSSGLADNTCQSAATEAASLKVGQRIRVKWCLTEEDGEDGVTKVRWWGATVTEASSTGYVIRYDAYGDFPEEEQKVMLTSADALQHEGQTDELEWRLERQVGEISDTEIDEDGMDDVVDLSEMMEDNEELERELGTTVEQATLSHLRENMAADQQLRMLAGFRHFADHIKDSLREKLQATGEGSYTVTADDVHAMLAGLRRQ